jgi:ferredoxin
MPVMHSLYREPGVVAIDQQTCKQCGQCVRICPAEVLQMSDGRVTVKDDSPFGCIACGHCMMVCPQGSITVTGREREYMGGDDLASVLIELNQVSSVYPRAFVP